MMAQSDFKKTKTLRIAVGTLALLAIFSVAGYWITNGPTTCSTSTDAVQKSNTKAASFYGGGSSGGATSERFRGGKVRIFPPEELVDFAVKSLREHAPQRPPRKHPKCDKWVVVTTIYEPSDAIKIIANHLCSSSSKQQQGWCMVIVADTKTPANYMTHEAWGSTLPPKDSVVFLSVADQEKLAKQIPFVASMPFRSFARKNVGYLYAIREGASVIFDVDDDNNLRVAEAKQGLYILNNLTQPLDRSIPSRSYTAVDGYEHRAVNPFSHMGASIAGTWPRGFPLNLIKMDESRGVVESQPKPFPLSQIGIVQSVCNHDPDVDAVYRLTRTLPFNFVGKESEHALVIPTSVYTPYNAQATLHYPNAYWGMYLPFSVNGRVSDIWRSYFVQRILRELQQPTHLVYGPPMVTQIRNAHDYIGDMMAEDHLYQRTEALLSFLDEWKPKLGSSTLPERFQDLWVQLYERRYVEKEDVLAVQQWLVAIADGGFQFPAVKIS